MNETSRAPRTSRTLRNLLLGLSLLTVAWVMVPAGAAEPTGPACKPVQVAESTQCVKDQLKPLRDAKTYDETTTVTDNTDGIKTVTFIFEPKCLHDPVPCRTPSRSISSTVDCKTGTATCP
jgi:hypothetical protein